MSDTNNKTINNIPTFTPEEVAAAIKPYLQVFTVVSDEIDYIQFKYWNNARQQFTYGISVGYRETGLFVYLRIQNAAHYVKSMEELRNVLEGMKNGAGQLDEFRRLVGLEGLKGLNPC